MAVINGQKSASQMLSKAAGICLNTAAFSDGPTNATKPNATTALMYLNEAYREISSEVEWSWMFDKTTFNTVVGQQTGYKVSDLEMDVYYMSIPAAQQLLGFSPWDRWVTSYPGRYTSVANTRPWGYIPGPPDTNNANLYFLFPAADAIYTVEVGFKKRISDLAVADYPVIPPEWQDVLENKLILKVFENLNDKRAEYWQKKYTQRWQMMWLHYERYQNYVARFRDLKREAAISWGLDINRALFVPF